MLAATTDTSYRIMLIVHILAILVAFAPLAIKPFMAQQLKGDPAWTRVVDVISKNGMRIHGSALIVAGLVGFGLAGMSKENGELLYSMSQGWLIASFVVWVAMNGVLHGLIIPSEKKFVGGDASAEQRMAMGGSVMTVLLVVMLYLMVFKPGL